MSTKLSSPRPLQSTVLGLLASCFVLLSAQAQGVGTGAEFLDVSQRWLDKAVSGEPVQGVTPLRMEVSVGELDARLRLAPCTRVEPYIPVGTQLWGKTRLGVRCVEGSVKWNVFLPVTVKAYGLAWVIKGNVVPGALLSEADAIETEVDWAAEASPVVHNSSQWIGQMATRALTTGQALRRAMIKPAQVFQAGAQVRVVAQGSGFEVTSDGQALSAGVVGQPARVRMDNGRVMSGVVMDSRTVRLEI
jgi:flagella basal body P-ring formation protein FlgA